MNEQELLYNRVHCSSRITIEWLIGALKNTFKSIKYKDGNRSVSTPIHQHVVVATHLFNIKTCLNEHNQISLFFNCDTVALHDYMSAFN